MEDTRSGTKWARGAARRVRISVGQDVDEPSAPDSNSLPTARAHKDVDRAGERPNSRFYRAWIRSERTDGRATRFISYSWNVTRVDDTKWSGYLERVLDLAGCERERPTLIIDGHLARGSQNQRDTSAACACSSVKPRSSLSNGTTKSLKYVIQMAFSQKMFIEFW
jgi:hypothetical protein